MDKEPLVSIITPCLNGEEFIDRYFQSVLNQTYSNMELIFVNDGSNDRTEEIALSYKESLEKKGVKYVYLYQENAGQAAAVNKGLKIFTGEYLTWPDSDDWMSNDCIEKKVEYLENNPDCGMVCCQSNDYREDDLKKINRSIKNNYTEKCNIFKDILLERNVTCACGCYMLRTSALKSELPELIIYESRAGQNWQLLLPVAYKYNCGFLQEPLYNIVVRTSSHTHRIDSYEKKKKQQLDLRDILEKTIGNIKMPQSEKNYYFKIIEEKYDVRLFYLAANYYKKQDLKKYYIMVKEKQLINKSKLYLRYLRGKHPFVDKMLKRLYFKFKKLKIM